MRHPCACCGHRTLDAPPGRTGQICPVCFWEDSHHPEGDAAGWNGSNGVGLEEAQLNFAELGACAPAFVGDARPPREDEPRAPGFRVFAEERDASAAEVRARIHHAFQDVRLGDGTSLHQAVAIDDFCSPAEVTNARKLDPEPHWTRIPCSKIGSLALQGVPTFLDAAGYRHHLPAYLCCWLEGTPERTGSLAFDAVLWQLQRAWRPPGSGWAAQVAAERLAALDPPQRHAVARFLQHLARFGTDPTEREEAQKALDRGWSDLLPDAGARGA